MQTRALEEPLLHWSTIEAAFRVLHELGAPPHLVRHHQLVGEAADLLLTGLAQAFPDLHIDATQVRLGARLHDAGKCAHPQELNQPGSLHEPAGYRLCIDAGVPDAIARHCVTHAAWAHHPDDLEVLVVALADKLWKGRRDEALEATLLAAVCAATGLDRWAAFPPLDDLFESVADDGSRRLQQSTEPPLPWVSD